MSSYWPNRLYWQLKLRRWFCFQSGSSERRSLFVSLLYSDIVSIIRSALGSLPSPVQTTAEIILARQHVVGDYCTLFLGNYTRSKTKMCHSSITMFELIGYKEAWSCWIKVSYGKSGETVECLALQHEWVCEWVNKRPLPHIQVLTKCSLYENTSNVAI